VPSNPPAPASESPDGEHEPRISTGISAEPLLETHAESTAPPGGTVAPVERKLRFLNQYLDVVGLLRQVLAEYDPETETVRGNELLFHRRDDPDSADVEKQSRCTESLLASLRVADGLPLLRTLFAGELIDYSAAKLQVLGFWRAKSIVMLLVDESGQDFTTIEFNGYRATFLGSPVPEPQDRTLFKGKRRELLRQYAAGRSYQEALGFNKALTEEVHRLKEVNAIDHEKLKAASNREKALRSELAHVREERSAEKTKREKERKVKKEKKKKEEEEEKQGKKRPRDETLPNELPAQDEKRKRPRTETSAGDPADEGAPLLKVFAPANTKHLQINADF